MANPCLDVMSLQSATIIIAILEMVGAIIGVLCSSITILGMLFFKEEITNLVPDYPALNNTSMNRVLHEPPGFFYGILTFLCIICLIELYLAAILLIGARGRRILKIGLWSKLKSCLLLVSVMFMLVASVTSPGWRLWILLFGTVLLLFQLYCLWTVKVFIDEIRLGKYHRRASSVYSNCEEEIYPEDGEEMQKL